MTITELSKKIKAQSGLTCEIDGRAMNVDGYLFAVFSDEYKGKKRRLETIPFFYKRLDSPMLPAMLIARFFSARNISHAPNR